MKKKKSNYGNAKLCKMMFITHIKCIQCLPALLIEVVADAWEGKGGPKAHYLWKVHMKSIHSSWISCHRLRSRPTETYSMICKVINKSSCHVSLKIWRSKTHSDFTVTYFETFILSLAWSVNWSEGCDNMVTYCEAESCNIMIPCQFNITPLTSRFFIIFKITKMCTLLFAFTKTRAQCSVTDSSQGCIILLD